MKRTTNQFASYLSVVAVYLLLLTACAGPEAPSDQSPTLKVSGTLPTTVGTVDSTTQLKYPSGIRSIFEDDHGNTWFGSLQEGVCKFDGETLTYFTEKDGLSNRQVRSIFQDEAGVVWFECGRGISSYDGERLVTHTFKNYFSKYHWQLSPTDLWFKGDEGTAYNNLEGAPGVYRYDGKQLSYHTFPIEPAEGWLNHYSVSTPFARGKNGRVWFGTYGAVIGYDGTSFTIIDDDKLGLNEETGYLHVRSIFEDSQGRLWIGNNGIGVWLHTDEGTIHFSEENNLISEGSLRSGGYRSPPGSLEHVFAIGEDPAGNIWFGDRDTGAWRYDGTTFTNFTEANGLTSKHIWQIYTTKAGELWLAMSDGSVCRFNGTAFEKIF
ncbi:MAG: two-component regulator propeller domain-containing protein [Bacteroidota bacterium]